MRSSLIEKIESLANESADSPPVVSLEEYFEGNDDESCIAPNQLDEGRPDLAAMYKTFLNIQARPDVQAVLVGIHGDWSESLKFTDVWPAAENIHIYSKSSRSEVERWISGMCADGVVKGWPYGKHPSAPEPLPGCNVYSVCWD